MEDIYKYKYIKFKTKYLNKKGGGYKNCKDCNKKEDANEICENIDSQGRKSLPPTPRKVSMERISLQATVPYKRPALPMLRSLTPIPLHSRQNKKRTLHFHHLPSAYKHLPPTPGSR